MKRTLFTILIAVIAGISSCKHETVVPDFGQTVSSYCDPDTVYFVNNILPFLSTNCAQSGCHDAESAVHGIILASYDDVKNSGIIKPGKPAESKLYTILNESNLRDIMPPPSTMINLTDNQISEVAKWIDQGARNNACTGLVCDSVNISFSEQILPLIEQNCKGCHLGNSSVPLNNYENISEIAGYSLFQVINHDSGYYAMPKNQPKLDSCKLQLVRVWIEEGALNN